MNSRKKDQVTNARKYKSKFNPFPILLSDNPGRPEEETIFYVPKPEPTTRAILFTNNKVRRFTATVTDSYHIQPYLKIKPELYPDIIEC